MMGRRHRGLASLVAIAFAAAAGAQAPDDPLSKWLYGLKVPIPDFSGSYDGFDFSMSDGSCTKILIGAMGAGVGHCSFFASLSA